MWSIESLHPSPFEARVICSRCRKPAQVEPRGNHHLYFCSSCSKELAARRPEPEGEASDCRCTVEFGALAKALFSFADNAVESEALLQMVTDLVEYAMEKEDVTASLEAKREKLLEDHGKALLLISNVMQYDLPERLWNELRTKLAEIEQQLAEVDESIRARKYRYGHWWHVLADLGVSREDAPLIRNGQMAVTLTDPLREWQARARALRPALEQQDAPTINERMRSLGVYLWVDFGEQDEEARRASIQVTIDLTAMDRLSRGDGRGDISRLN